MKTLVLILMLTFALIAKGQTNKVDIEIFNSTKDTLIVYLTESKTGAMNDIGNNLFTPENLLPGTALKKKEIKISRFSIIKVWGEFLNKGGKTETIQEIVQKDMKTFNKTLAVQIDPSNQKEIVSLSTLANKYKYNPSLFYDKKDLSPKPIEGLFSQYLGSIIAYTEVGDSIKIERRIFPSTINTTDRIHFGTQTNTDEFIINGETDQTANGNIPMFGELGVSIQANNTYEVRLSYRGIGVIDWINHNKIDIDKAFFKLSDTTLYVLGEMRERFPTLRLDIIDKAFVFDGIFAEVVKMNRLSIGNTVNAATFFNTKGYYTRENKALNSETFGSSYIGYWSSRTVDLTGALDLASYVYSNKKIIELQNQNNSLALSDFSKLRETNPLLPNLKTKKEIEEFYKSKHMKLMEIHEIDSNLDLKFKNELKNKNINNLEEILSPSTKTDLEKKFRSMGK